MLKGGGRNALRLPEDEVAVQVTLAELPEKNIVFFCPVGELSQLGLVEAHRFRCPGDLKVEEVFFYGLILGCKSIICDHLSRLFFCCF